VRKGVFPRELCFDTAAASGSEGLPAVGIVHEFRQRARERPFIVWGDVNCGGTCGKAMLGQVKCNNRLAQRHVFHDFEHRRAVGIGIGGRGVYANIGSGEKLTEFFAENRTREAHMVLQGKFPRQSLQIFKRVTKANDYAIEIVPPKTAKEVIQRPQEIVHSILNAHHAYVPDNGLSPLPQLLIGFDGNHGATRSEDHYRSEEHTSELQSLAYLVCRLLLEIK